MEERSARLAANEGVFRAGNEAIDANRDNDTKEELPYLCECGVATCFERVALTPEEYEAVRAYPARFFVVPGHEDLSAEEVVVEKSSRYAVVEKHGDARRVVERADRPARGRR